MPQLVLFKSGNMPFAIHQDCIGAIETRTSNATAGQGCLQCNTISHKGRSHLLVDLSAALGPDVALPRDADAKIIVAKDSSIALWADRINETLTVDAEEIESLPGVFSRSAGACFTRVLRLKNQLALVIDSDALAKLARVVAAPAPAGQSGAKRAETVTSSEQAGVSSNTGDASGDHALEGIVVSKLQQFIAYRVKQALARTWAETLDRHRVRL